MQELRTLRTRWADVPSGRATDAPDDVRERVAHLAELFEAFQAQLEQSEAAFRPERRRHLAELQERLRRADR
jgi:hypothetical protein